VTVTDADRAIEAVWRIESARITAGLTGMVRDVGLAEELAQDALVAALEQWPESGIPPNPGAWLMATAKHRAIDRLRRNERLERKLGQLGREIEIQRETAVFGGAADHLGGVRAGHHRFGGDTAGVDAGSAEEFALDDGHPLPRPGQPPGERRSGLAGPDHDGVERSGHLSKILQ